MGGVIICHDTEATTLTVPHKRVGSYFFAQLPAGDFAVHRHDRDYEEGYGRAWIEFLMDDGTIEQVKGPFREYELHLTATEEDLEKRFGIAGLSAYATKITVGRNLGLYQSKPPEVEFSEDLFAITPWTERMLPEWEGLEVMISTRRSKMWPTKSWKPTEKLSA